MTNNRDVAQPSAATKSPTATALPVFSTAAVNSLLNEAALKAFKAAVESDRSIVRTTGRIIALPATTYSRYYDVPLESDGSTVYLELPKKIVEAKEISIGDFVAVTGALRANVFKGVVRMRLDVWEIDPVDSPEECERKRADLAALTLVRELRKNRTPFPYKERVTISLITGPSSQVRDDLVLALGTVRSIVAVVETRVPMDAPGEIAKAIEAAEGEILVLIRGGGSADDFGAFDDERVVAAMGSKDAFCIAGIGHSGNQGIVDLVADHSASTASAAGAFIERQLEAVARTNDQFQQALARERGALAAATAINEKKSAEIYGLRSEVQKLQDQVSTSSASNVRRTKLLAAVAFFVGLVVAWAATHLLS